MLIVDCSHGVGRDWLCFTVDCGIVSLPQRHLRVELCLESKIAFSGLWSFRFGMCCVFWMGFFNLLDIVLRFVTNVRI